MKSRSHLSKAELWILVCYKMSGIVRLQRNGSRESTVHVTEQPRKISQPSNKKLFKLAHIPNSLRSQNKSTKSSWTMMRFSFSKTTNKCSRKSRFISSKSWSSRNNFCRTKSKPSSSLNCSASNSSTSSRQWNKSSKSRR